jgi:transcription elongation factor Elf1
MTMNDECPKCKQIVSVKPWIDKNGTKGFSAKCPHCGAEYDGVLMPIPPKPVKVKDEGSSTQNLPE